MSRVMKAAAAVVVVVGVVVLSGHSPEAANLLLMFVEALGIPIPRIAELVPEIGALLGAGGIVGVIANYAYYLVGGFAIGAAGGKLAKVAAN